MVSRRQLGSDVAHPLQPRLLAFYLPQFHPVPENDASWGEGFTEWASVVRAKPLFPGHYQPRIPADLGFYDLRLPEVRQAQTDLAKEYGVHGFCYHHYWFEGRRVLERPLDEVLASGHPDFPFCLCWANHSWIWQRPNRNRGRLIAQRYSEEDDRTHIRWLLRVFEDERYVRVNGRPLVLVYMAQSMPDPKRTFGTWREEARKAEVAEPYICKVDTMGNFDNPGEVCCDAAVEFWPHGASALVKPDRGPRDGGGPDLAYEYWELSREALQRPEPPFRRYPCVVPDWDNTARMGAEARLLRGSTPELYGEWLEGAIRRVAANPPEEQLIFINAWNEWAEGAYLEPDFKYGRAYLEATRRALRKAGVEVPVEKLGAAEVPAPASTEKLYRDLLKKYKRLQHEHTERLAAEEQSPLLQEAERRIEELEQSHRQLAAQQERLRKRNEKLIRQLAASKDGDAGLQGGEDLSKLVRWMREIDAGVSALLTSRRWKLGSILVDAGRRVLLKPSTATAQDRLVAILAEFRAWAREANLKR